VNKGIIRDPSDVVRDSSRSPVDSSHQILKDGHTTRNHTKALLQLARLKQI
jgi:hypothetical protein